MFVLYFLVSITKLTATEGHEQVLIPLDINQEYGRLYDRQLGFIAAAAEVKVKIIFILLSAVVASIGWPVLPLVTLS